MTSSTIELAYDDNLVIFTRLYAFSLTSANANLNTRKLMIYTDSLALNSNIIYNDKTLQLHCNDLNFSSSTTVIDLSGLPDLIVYTKYITKPGLMRQCKMARV